MVGFIGATTWSFENDESGKAPVGFEFATTRKTPSGRWEVAQDAENTVLAQFDRDKTEGRFTMAVVKDSSFKDLKLSVRVKPISGEIDQTGGLVWRYTDADNYYIARSNVLEKNVRLYRVINGNRIKFAGKEEVNLKANDWHILSIEHKGTLISVSLNGTRLFEAKDEAFPDTGKIGVWTKADSVTYFDDLTVEALR